MNPVSFSARDGRDLAGFFGRSSAPVARGAIVINGATGFPRESYYKFAEYCRVRGYHVLIYDYRGMGASAIPHQALRDERARMSDWGMYDMPAALDLLAALTAPLPIVTVGHSIGGQLLGLMPNHEKARCHVLVAASTGYWRWEHFPQRYLAWFLWYVWGPLMLATRGYLPRSWLWAGLSLPPQVLRQWRRWCTRAEHFTPEIGIGKPIPNNYYDDVTAPLLFVSLSDDWIATRKTVGALQGFFSRAKLQNRWWTPQEVGAKSIGHGGFFQSRFQDSLWRETIDWIDAHLD